MTDHPFGVSLYFHVTLDGMDLGDWTKCEGLTVEYEVEEYKEGGQNGFVHRLPGRAKYQNIKLSRPLDARSRQLLTCLASVQKEVKRRGASIELVDQKEHKAIFQWNVSGVYPVKWTGPTLDFTANNVAVESLELAHEGFLVQG
jgi:phage tail-like protein